MLGVDWCTAKRWAIARGVRVLKPSKRKSVIVASELLDALGTNVDHGLREPDDDLNTDIKVDPRAEVLRALGRQA